MAEENKEQGKEGAVKKGLPIGKILLILFVVIDFAGLGLGGFLTFKATLGWDPPVYTEDMASQETDAMTEAQDNMPLIFTMETFKANLSGAPVRGIELEVNVEMMDAHGLEELMLDDSRAKARDSILAILGSKSFEEVESVQGKLFLKDQIAVALNEILDKGIVKDVYFTDFRVE